MSWGKGIAFVILGFVVFMSTMVYKAVNQDFYLISVTPMFLCKVDIIIKTFT